MFTKILQEHRAGTGAYDALNVIPSWMPDLARAGALEALDPYVDKYGYRDELQKIAPVFRDNQMKVDGKIYGFPDDGDIFVMYYRTDILGDPKIQDGFKAEARPRSAGAAQDLEGVRRGRPVHDREHGRQALRRGVLPRPALRPVHVPGALPERGRQVLRRRHHEGDGQRRRSASRCSPTWVAENKWMPPGVETWGFVENLAAFLPGRDGDDDLLAALWPLGRGLRHQTRRRCSWVPKSTDRRQGRLRHAAGRPSRARRRLLRSRSPRTAKHKEPAYLFIQWLNSEEIASQRVQLPYALRDPFRDNHYTERRVQGAAGRRRRSISQALHRRRRQRPARPVAAADRQVRGGAAPGHLARSGPARTRRRSWMTSPRNGTPSPQRIGVDKQKAAYKDWASKPNAYPK